MDMKDVGITSLLLFAGVEPSEHTSEILKRFDELKAENERLRGLLGRASNHPLLHKVGCVAEQSQVDCDCGLYGLQEEISDGDQSIAHNSG